MAAGEEMETESGPEIEIVDVEKDAKVWVFLNFFFMVQKSRPYLMVYCLKVFPFMQMKVKVKAYLV